MAKMKQLSSFMILGVDGGDRISYTFNVIDEDTGELTSRNNKGSFFAVDSELRGHVEAIREHIRANKLAEKQEV